MTVGAPLRAIQFMVERTSRTGLAIGPDEAVDVETALRSWTVEAARACHWEDDLGSLTPGRLADLVVLADDPRRVPTGRIADIEVLGTVLGGAVDLSDQAVDGIGGTRRHRSPGGDGRL